VVVQSPCESYKHNGRMDFAKTEMMCNLFTLFDTTHDLGYIADTFRLQAQPHIFRFLRGGER
jgi:hypothetical protein